MMFSWRFMQLPFIILLTPRKLTNYAENVKENLIELLLRHYSGIIFFNPLDSFLNFVIDIDHAIAHGIIGYL